MINILKPNESKTSIYDIDITNLQRMGYKHILIDVDNTITPWNSKEISDRLRLWVGECRALGMSICLFTNNYSQRVEDMASVLNIQTISKGGKPFKFAFNRALAYIGGDPQNTVMIGDQVFTDILGGNNAGLYTILVDPITGKEFWGTKLNRFLERLLFGKNRRKL
ncbi:MAG: YqeG family HAD IIIA-type phosphatase [Clostridiales bacterium]|nr:YqeG family HAD IIIA-type phosphatase [Clostridiales bacterium]